MVWTRQVCGVFFFSRYFPPTAEKPKQCHSSCDGLSGVQSDTIHHFKLNTAARKTSGFQPDDPFEVTPPHPETSETLTSGEFVFFNAGLSSRCANKVLLDRAALVPKTLTAPCWIHLVALTRRDKWDKNTQPGQDNNPFIWSGIGPRLVGFTSYIISYSAGGRRGAGKEDISGIRISPGK